MSNESNIRYGRHCVFKLHVHWVFVAKYRRCVFDAEAIDVLRGICADVCSDAHATLVQMDDEDDHEHLLVEHPPRVAVSSLVNSLKGGFQSLAAPAEDAELTFTTASLSARSL